MCDTKIESPPGVRGGVGSSAWREHAVSLGRRAEDSQKGIRLIYYDLLGRRNQQLSAIYLLSESKSLKLYKLDYRYR